MAAPFVWFDLTTTGGWTKVSEFYASLFGWTTGPAISDYHGWLTDGDEPWGGFAPAGPVPAGRWLPYVVVKDVDTATRKALVLGASVVREKLSGPAGTR